MRIATSLLLFSLSMLLGCWASPSRSRSTEVGLGGEASASFVEPESAGVGGMGLPSAESLPERDECREEAIRAFEPGPGELQMLSSRTEISIALRPGSSTSVETICEPEEDDDACLQRGVEAALEGRPGWAVALSDVRSPEERVLAAELLVDGQEVRMVVADADALVTMVRMHEEEGKVVSVLSTELRPAVDEKMAVVSAMSPDAEARRVLRRTMWFRWWPEVEGPEALERVQESAEAAGLTLLQALPDPEGGYLLSVTCP